MKARLFFAYLDLCKQLATARAEVEQMRAKVLQSRWCETTGLLLHDTPQCDVCPQCNVARAALGEEVTDE